MKDRIIATDDTIHDVVHSEIRVLGPRADLNHVDVSNVTNLYGLFANSNFTGDISEWDVSRVTNMSHMFSNCRFNGDISQWNVTNVTNMRSMFAHSKFKGDISGWNTAKAIRSYLFTNNG